jgi:hypothetical protein
MSEATKITELAMKTTASNNTKKAGQGMMLSTSSSVHGRSAAVVSGTAAVTSHVAAGGTNAMENAAIYLSLAKACAMLGLADDTSKYVLAARSRSHH